MIETAFIFDMDGVIIDSTQAHTDTWREYLVSHGIVIEDIDARMLGKHNDEIVQDFFGSTPLTATEILEHGARKEALYRERISPVFDRQLVPGVCDFIRRHPDVPKGIASNAEPANVDFVLQLSGLAECFPVLVTGHDVDRPKPYPDIFLKAADLLGVPPADCVVFEDSVTGVTAARAAGMRVVGLLTTLANFDNVDLAVRDFRDPVLDRWLDSMASRP